MRTRLLTMLAAALLALALAPAASAKSHITLDGVDAETFWSDGDSFRVTSGPQKGLKSRIVQFNTLESYGPVHRWGTWTSKELSALAKKATEVVRAGSWRCETLKRRGQVQKDHYGRVLIRCPDAAMALVEQGLAHAMFVDENEVDRPLVEAQHRAQKAQVGMWAKGVPSTILTSVHSADEPNSDKPYNRVVDTATGLSKKIFHENTYGHCTEACEGESCLLYVPFDQRYGKRRADCLRWDAERPVAPIPAPAEGGGGVRKSEDPAPRAKPAQPVPAGVSPVPTPSATGDADEVL